MPKESTDTKPMTLAAKLARIGKEIGAIDKSGRNMKQNYNYIEYGVVAGRIRELFDQYGVIIVPSVEQYTMDEIKNSYGNTGFHYVLQMSFTIINADDMDDKITAKWSGESADYGDKGINKAETSGTKYFLMRLFNVSEKGEEEADSNSPEIESTRRAVKKITEKVAQSEFGDEEIKLAKEKLNAAKNLGELKKIFLMLGKVRNCPDVVEEKDKLKQSLAENDLDVKMANAKDAIDEQFGEKK